MVTLWLGLSLGMLCGAAVCGAQDTPSKASPPGDTPCWSDISADVGLEFQHRHFGHGEKYMPENMGAGAALFDADGDGRLDVYFVQGAPWPSASSPGEGAPRQATVTNQLFLQQADGRFVDVTAASGAADTGYGMGVAVGDVDGDSDLDVYVTNFGSDALYRNRGDGVFEDVTAAAGLGLGGWSAGAAFLDLEGDGDLDLFVSRYLDYDPAASKWCGNARRKIRSYCHPDIYSGASDRLYRNRGDGTFEDISATAGLRPAAKAKGLGVLTYDLDGDGYQDVYVANDSTMNFFYRGQGRGRFQEDALLHGLGFNGSGAAEASMGIAYGDLDGDGDGELYLTHLDQESNTLYRGGGGTFEDATRKAGLERPSMPWVGFGTAMLDVDHDGDLDLMVANGHIIDNIALFDGSRSHRQPLQLMLNDGRGRFRDASSRLGSRQPLVGRGLATGDVDGDGDLDVLVTQNGDRALLLRNDCAPPSSALKLRLRGAKNTGAVGARVELRRGELRRVRHVTGGGSYLSHSAAEVHFGVGLDHDIPWEVIVRWPNGKTQTHRDLRAGATYVVTEGSPTAEPLPFGDPTAGSAHVSTPR